MPRPRDVTLYLQRMADGDSAALDQVMRLLYDELRTLARAQLRQERPGHTLGNTALVNELYLKLANQKRIDARDRSQFFRVAATTMRRLLVDYARSRHRLKRGGGEPLVPLEEVESWLSEEQADEILALDEALDRLASINPRGAEVVQQRFYVGLSLEETAELLGVSSKTAWRDWTAARAWLRKEVRADLD